MRKSRKIITLIMIVSLSSLLITGLAFGKDENSPLADLWNAIFGLQAADVTLQDEIDAVAVADVTLQAEIDAEENARATADTALQAAIAALQAAINLEETARQDADVTLQAAIAALQAAINLEETARQDADVTLQNEIDAEEAARWTADDALNNRIDVEENARATADTALQAAIAALQAAINLEETARQDADVTLQNEINAEAAARLNADTVETAARIAEFNALLEAILDEEDARRYDDLNEQIARIDADTAEEVARLDADTILQNQIEILNIRTPQTGKISIPAASFVKRDSTQLGVNYGQWIENGEEISAFYHAGVQLPHGAKIMRLTVYWFNDGSEDGEIRLSFLRKSGDFDSEPETIAYLSCVDYGENVHEEVIIPPVTVNNEYSYYLQLEFYLDTNVDSRFYYAVIDYEYPI